jgi:hypothetical protein
MEIGLQAIRSVDAGITWNTQGSAVDTTSNTLTVRGVTSPSQWGGASSAVIFLPLVRTPQNNHADASASRP